MKLTEKQRLHLRDILKSALATGVSEVVFEKADGSIRVLKATRDAKIIPQKPISENAVVVEVKPRKESTTTLPVYDVESGWRSFKIESLVSINGLKADALVRLV